MNTVLLLVAALLVLYGITTSLTRAARRIDHILRETETRKEKPKP